VSSASCFFVNPIISATSLPPSRMAEEGEKVGSWFLEAGCHPVDVLRWMAGDIVEVAAYSNRKVKEIDFPGDDCHVAVLNSRTGALEGSLISASCKRPIPYRAVSVWDGWYFQRGRGPVSSEDTGLTDFMSLPCRRRVFIRSKTRWMTSLVCVRETGILVAMLSREPRPWPRALPSSSRFEKEDSSG